MVSVQEGRAAALVVGVRLLPVRLEDRPLHAVNDRFFEIEDLSPDVLPFVSAEGHPRAGGTPTPEKFLGSKYISSIDVTYLQMIRAQ